MNQNEKNITTVISRQKSIVSKIKKRKQADIINILNGDIEFFTNKYNKQFIDYMPWDEDINIYLLPSIKFDSNFYPLKNPELYPWKRDSGIYYAGTERADYLDKKDLSHDIYLSMNVMTNEKKFNEMVKNSKDREQAQSFVFFHEIGHLIDSVACSYTKKSLSGENAPFIVNRITESEKMKHFILEDTIQPTNESDITSHIFCKNHIKENIADCWSVLLTYEKYKDYSIKDVAESVKKTRKNMANNKNIIYQTNDTLSFFVEYFDEQKTYSFQEKLDLIQKSAEKGLMSSIEKIIKREDNYQDEELAKSLYFSFRKENIKIEKNDSIVEKLKTAKSNQDNKISYKYFP